MSVKLSIASGKISLRIFNWLENDHCLFCLHNVIRGSMKATKKEKHVSFTCSSHVVQPRDTANAPWLPASLSFIDVTPDLQAGNKK
jgi:hypothetical protein